jgi:hypothetical protein
VHADPQDFEALQMRASAFLGGGAAQEHVIEDDPGAGPGHGRHAGHPRGLDLAEAATDGDLTIPLKGDARTRVEQRRRQRIDEVIHAEPDPRLRQDGL